MDLLYLIVGGALGAVVTYFLVKNKSLAALAGLKERNVLLEQENKNWKQELRENQSELIALNNKLAFSESHLANVQEKLSEQKGELVKLRETFNMEFKNLANEILEEKAKRFTEQNKTNISEILTPLNNRIKEFEKKVEETYDKEAQQRFSLKEQVRQLAELNQQISKEANSLTKALKGESKTQGNWGEMILESILEQTGLRKGEEYTVQESFTAESGKRYQPDVVVHYPGDRSVVIDSKVSLTAYERLTSAETDSDKADAIKAHLLSIRNHINELSEKKYEDLQSVKTLDFVMMFLPVEPAYLVAIQNDPQLWMYAYNKRILLISPTNLVVVLKMVESLWKQEFQSRNVLEIARQGGALYDNFVMLSERLVNLGKRIDDASNLYRETMQKLSEGRGNLIGRVENLKALGVKAKKQMPDSLLRQALDAGDEQ